MVVINVGSVRARFTVGSVFHIPGRGPAIARTAADARAAYEAGERWRAGDGAFCPQLGRSVTVAGIERHAVDPSHPAYFDGALLLKGIEMSDLGVGQDWLQF